MIENSQANSFNFCYQTSTIPTARKNAKINRIFPPVNKCLMAIFRIIIRTFPNYFLKKLLTQMGSVLTLSIELMKLNQSIKQNLLVTTKCYWYYEVTKVLPRENSYFTTN